MTGVISHITYMSPAVVRQTQWVGKIYEKLCVSHLAATTQEHIVSVRKVLSLILILDDKKEASDIPKEKCGGTPGVSLEGKVFCFCISAIHT